MDARFGHHYTHAFFTITDEKPHVLRRLSQEFLFPSQVWNRTDDADVIQYASGLEWVADSRQSRIAIGYGINDCEAAIVEIDRSIIERMLVQVPNGTEVRDLMTNWTRPTTIRQH